MVRTVSAITVNTMVRAFSISKPVQMSDVPSATKVSRSSISAVASPYSRKQSHSSTSLRAHHYSRGERGEKPAPSDTLGERKRAECEAERIERLVVAAHSDLRANLSERNDADPADSRAKQGSEKEKSNEASAQLLTRHRHTGRMRTKGENGEHHDRQKQNVVRSGFDSECSSGFLGHRSRSERAAQKDLIGRRESRAEYRSGRPGKVENKSRCQCNESGWYQRARAEKSPEQMLFCSNQLQVDRYGIAEQKQSEAEHRQRMQRRRMKADVEKIQPIRDQAKRPAREILRQEEGRLALAPERRDATTMTIPIRATVVVKLSKTAPILCPVNGEFRRVVRDGPRSYTAGGVLVY